MAIPMHNQHGIRDRLLELRFRPAPAPFDREGHGDVTTGCPDGVYFNVGADSDVQLIIVGPMRMSPIEFAHLIDLDYWVKSAQFMEPGPENIPAARQIIIERGFVDIRLRRHDVEPHPGRRQESDVTELKVV